MKRHPAPGLIGHPDPAPARTPDPMSICVRPPRCVNIGHPDEAVARHPAPAPIHVQFGEPNMDVEAKPHLAVVIRARPPQNIPVAHIAPPIERIPVVIPVRPDEITVCVDVGNSVRPQNPAPIGIMQDCALLPHYHIGIPVVIDLNTHLAAAIRLNIAACESDMQIPHPGPVGDAGCNDAVNSGDERRAVFFHNGEFSLRKLIEPDHRAVGQLNLDPAARFRPYNVSFLDDRVDRGIPPSVIVNADDENIAIDEAYPAPSCPVRRHKRGQKPDS